MKPKKGKSYPVNIVVLNAPEGVAFKPAVKPISVSENPKENPLMKVIAVYAATDTDTGKLGENVRYAKGYDPANWLVIDPKTAEIKLQTYPDRESPFLVNGTYYAKILGLTEDVPPKIVTGTIALQVGDENDNCPSLTNNVRYTCSDTEVIYVTAVDEDGDPNSAPFSFSLLEKESQDEWRIEIDPFNGTSALLRALKPLWPGHYQVGFIIEDRQGFACPDQQYLDLYVCSCEEGEICGYAAPGASPGLPGLPSAAYLKESSSKFGELGVGALILGLLMLLSLLLVAYSCGPEQGVFSDLPFDTIPHLIVYRTEGKGEDKNVLSTPAMITSTTMTTAQVNNIASKREMILNTGTANNMSRSRCLDNSRNQQSSCGESRQSWKDICSLEDQLEGMDSMTISDVFLHQYYSQKASYTAMHEAAMDCLREHAFEGQGSSAGSVGCCSLLESDNDLHFLDDLEPKFKTLADVCSPPRPPTPPTHQATAIPEVDEVAHIAGPSLEAKPPSIHDKSTERNQNVSINQSSTRSIAFNGTASRSTCRDSSDKPFPGHMLLLQQQQQPVYYTTTPMLQPMHYIIQPQIQSPVLLAKAPVTNMQGMILCNGISGHSEHILHGGNTAGTLTFSRQRGNRVVSEDYGVGTWMSSNGQAEVMGVNRKGRRIKSESGDWMENCRKVTLNTRHVSVGAAGSEVLQQVVALHSPNHIATHPFHPNTPPSMGVLCHPPTVSAYSNGSKPPHPAQFESVLQEEYLG
ncbi:desmoglein-2-like [Larimichthys crocea]|uniref:desmoglein-2-like n=1 Tax=Larimichthys crocea TaxID=215358 RepID=UPI000F602729|nr:desmoglein-2-like [Larimichthys crocea]